MKPYLPEWLHPWLHLIALAGEVVLILFAAWLLRGLARRLIARVVRRYALTQEVEIGARRLTGFLIGFAALLAILKLFGVSGGVLWAAFTGFATVAAVAFFAAWSVLTNVFCAFLLMITRPFRLNDHVELVESGDKPGIGGRVIDVNLIYVTLQERHPDGRESEVRVPNSLFFQRGVRRWDGEPPLRRVASEATSDAAPARIGGSGASALADAD